MKVPYGDGSGAVGLVDIPMCGETPKQFKVQLVKRRDIVSGRKDTLLKNVEYLETQIGRLAKMARDIRTEILSLAVE